MLSVRQAVNATESLQKERPGGLHFMPRRAIMWIESDRDANGYGPGKREKEMTFGEKLSRLRKEYNYTQEQLADILEVSRQSVSKWESDIAYPETEKLVRLGKLFHCSMDYLLNEEVTERQTPASAPVAEPLSQQLQKLFVERKSERRVWGMPLYHIGRDARGFFAIGLRARGIVSVGLLSRGVVSLGLLSLGLLSFGSLSLGMIALGMFAIGPLALGAIALGLLAFGAIAVGILSFGALSVGCFSAGALAIGKYIAVGDHARAMIAIGKTKAVGTVYQTFAASYGIVEHFLDAHVPSWLTWAGEMFKMFYRIFAELQV